MTTIFYVLISLLLGINTPTTPQNNGSKEEPTIKEVIKPVKDSHEKTIDNGVGLIQMDLNEDFLAYRKTIDAGVMRS